MPINEQEFESVKQTLDTLMKSFLPKFIGKLNAVDARVQGLEAYIEVLKSQPVQPVEKPKRKRRTKAEIAAEKAESEQAAVDAAVDAAVAAAEDPVEELPDTPVEVAGYGITAKTVSSVMMVAQQCGFDIEATVELAGKYNCPAELVRYVMNMTDAEREEVNRKFPL